MKNKLFKTLGVGLLLTFGGLLFTGCSTEQLTDEQIKTTFDTIEQSQQYMVDTYNELKEQNEKLQAMVDELKQSNNKITKEQAWDIYVYAISRLSVDPSLYGNVQVLEKGKYGSYTSSDEDASTWDYIQKNYVLADGTFVRVVAWEDGDMDIHYQISGNKMGICYLTNGGTTVEEAEVENKTFYSDIIFDGLFETDKDSIVDCVKLDDGNYKITFAVKRVEEQDTYIKTGYAIISADGLLLKEEYNMLNYGEIIDPQPSHYYCASDWYCNEYIYGELTETEMAELYNLAKTEVDKVQ